MAVIRIARAGARMKPVAAAALALSGVTMVAAAIDNTEGLEACLSAAREAHPGIVVEWEVEDGTGRGFRIDLVARDGGSWRLTCDPSSSALDRQEQVLGRQDFDALSGRAKVPEARARETVRTYFPGRFIDMQYSLTWRGGAVYEYTVITPDDREAIIEVDAALGRILRSRSTARY
jgi:uncharacterized membrane protein YkoI